MEHTFQIDSEGVIWVMTNNLPLYNYATIDTNEYSYRIWKAPVDRAVQGTPCGDIKTSDLFGIRNSNRS